MTSLNNMFMLNTANTTYIHRTKKTEEILAIFARWSSLYM